MENKKENQQVADNEVKNDENGPALEKLFATQEEKVIGGKAIGAYLGTLGLYLPAYFKKYPEGKDDLSHLLGYVAGVCVNKIL